MSEKPASYGTPKPPKPEPKRPDIIIRLPMELPLLSEILASMSEIAEMHDMDAVMMEPKDDLEGEATGIAFVER